MATLSSCSSFGVKVTPLASFLVGDEDFASETAGVASLEVMSAVLLAGVGVVWFGTWTGKD